MSSAANGFSLHITIYISPDDLPKFWEAFQPVYDKVIAEPECTFFEVYQSPEDPGTLSWVENWYVVISPRDVRLIQQRWLTGHAGPRQRNGFSRYAFTAGHGYRALDDTAGRIKSPRLTTMIIWP